MLSVYFWIGLALCFISEIRSSLFVYETHSPFDEVDNHCIPFDEYFSSDLTAPRHTRMYYCFRAGKRNTSITFDSLPIYNMPWSKTSFKNMRQKNMTVSDLLNARTGSMDLIERYQIYLLNDENSDLANSDYFHCAQFSFGASCQFHFPFFTAEQSFAEILHQFLNVSDDAEQNQK